MEWNNGLLAGLLRAEAAWRFPLPKEEEDLTTRLPKPNPLLIFGRAERSGPSSTTNTCSQVNIKE